MSHSSKGCLLGLLILAGSASAITVGPVKGKPVPGRPLEVNVPFAVDGPADRACASANVRYGNAFAPPSVLHVQGRGLKRNLLVTSRANVNEPTVTVNVRVGCGAKAVARRFVMPVTMAFAKGPQLIEPATTRQPAAIVPLKAVPRSADVKTPGEPLFPPAPAPESAPQESDAPKADASAMEELRKARTDAAAAVAQLEATRRELAAVLDVERRTSQTLINADHEVRDARAEAAHMRLILKWVGAALALGAAGLVWLEFNRVLWKRRTSPAQAAQEPGGFPGMELQATCVPSPSSA